MEYVTSIAGSIVGKITDYVFNLPARQLGYLVNYNDNIQSLKDQAENLTNMQKRVQGNIDAAKKKGEQIVPDVQKWVEQVVKIDGDTKLFLEDENKADKSCINLSSRYRFSRAAHKKTSVISKLQLEGGFGSVSRPAPPPGITSSSTSISRLQQEESSERVSRSAPQPEIISSSTAISGFPSKLLDTVST